jgi:TolB-like protein
VLPFENLSGDPDQQYFADGITEDIIAALSRPLVLRHRKERGVCLQA